MYIIKVEYRSHENEKVDIIVENNSLSVLFVIKMLEVNECVIRYQILKSDGILVYTLKEEFNFSDLAFSKFSSVHQPTLCKGMKS